MNNGETYKGKFFKMTANVSTTAMVGDYGTNAFMGTFDGDGHTLTVSYTGITEDRTAPFRRISGATIKNLHTAGTIETSARYASGIVGYSRYYSKIENCRSSVTIRSSHDGWASHGGIMALKANVGLSKPTIEGCVFDGKILSTGATASTNCAGIVGYTNGQTLTISNCLYVPATLESGETSAEFGSTLYNNSIDSQPKTTVTCENCYYTEARGTAQGTHATTYAEAPTYLGTLVKDYKKAYGFVTAYSNGILFNNNYYVGDAENITFADDANNDIASVVGKYVNVTIDGRTLFKDNSWNTLCLPFNVTSEQINAQDGDNNYTSPLHGATIMELDVEGKYDADGNLAANGSYQTSFASDGTLNLYFKAAESIEAGKPYIVKWETTGDPIVKPTFSSVTIESSDTKLVTSADGNVSFVGNYDPVYTDEYGDATKLYLGAGNKLYYPSGIRAINAFRAYFQLNNGITAGTPKSGQQQVRAFYLNFGEDEETTGITTTNYTNFTNSDNAWYDMQGRKVARSASPLGSSKNGQWSMVNGQLKKGLYIHNGKKVVIK